eukprot:CAMPEP_0180676106 /NCGR_PEP_ID=MMETSP1037_2-20121125/67122_1 /TAXON_ID=632150 /ORGANISM="Azadinium spinosum, Strain 3D9" /LENGTH=50 /DNA_ID=CAMNT_0022705561 /DNA_START=66 /DNA_END=218 /DNA_ORIENTATION=-
MLTTNNITCNVAAQYGHQAAYEACSELIKALQTWRSTVRLQTAKYAREAV